MAADSKVEKTCSVDGCTKPVRARDLCSGHYRRLNRAEKGGSATPRRGLDAPLIDVHEEWHTVGSFQMTKEETRILAARSSDAGLSPYEYTRKLIEAWLDVSEGGVKSVESVEVHIENPFRTGYGDAGDGTCVRLGKRHYKQFIRAAQLRGIAPHALVRAVLRADLGVAPGGSRG